MKKNWIYEKSENNNARFLLGIEGKKQLICMGINPSTAEPNRLDNTIKRVEHISREQGYDSWLMLNVYPLRTTNPNELPMKIDFSLHQKNIEFIESVFSNNKQIDIWAAWGALIKKRSFLTQCLKNILFLSKKYNISWYTIGEKSKDGHPHHPLFLKSGLSMDLFNIEDYKKTLQNGV